MRHRSPHSEGSAGTAGSRSTGERSPDTDRDDDLELVPRLQAILDEIDVLDADVDVVRTLTLGLLEDVEAAV